MIREVAMNPTIAKWTARSLAAAGILVYGFACWEFISQPGRQLRDAASLPFVATVPPFGKLGSLTLVAGFALALVGSILAFRWESAAVRPLLAAGIVQALFWIIFWAFTTKPPTAFLMGLLLFVLPPLVIAQLLRIHSRAERAANA